MRELKFSALLLIFLFLTGWWVLLKTSPFNTDFNNQVFGATYGLVAFLGGLWGLSASRGWGGYRSMLGKALILFSMGLLAQEFGQLVYSYFIWFLRISVPYPSLGDVGYFGSIPCYIIGVVYLAKSIGINISLKTFWGKLQALIIPIILLLISYFFFLRGYEFDLGNPIRIFLDFGYPLGQAVYISITIVTYILQKDKLGGIMKSKVLLILLALSLQYVSDYTFLYQSSRGTWSVGGINDYMYLVSYFVMSLALIRLGAVAKDLKGKQ